MWDKNCIVKACKVFPYVVPSYNRKGLVPLIKHLYLRILLRIAVEETGRIRLMFKSRTVKVNLEVMQEKL